LFAASAVTMKFREAGVDGMDDGGPGGLGFDDVDDIVAFAIVNRRRQRRGRGRCRGLSGR
jgi:hypothetical protein